MSCHRQYISGALLLAASITSASVWAEDAATQAPMPQTRGMQGMDPTLHDKWAKEGEQDPHKDCKPNAEKAAQMKKHPMPDTKGMKDMDAKAHEMDCPEAPAAKADDKPGHVHKATGG